MIKSSESQISRLRRNRQIMVVLVLLLVLVIVWVVVSLFSSQRKSKLPDNIKALSQPLAPTFDRSTLETIKLKPSFTAKELESFPIYKLIFNKQNNSEQLVTIEVDEEDLLVAKSTPAPTMSPTPAAVTAPPAETLPTGVINSLTIEPTPTEIPSADVGENIP